MESLKDKVRPPTMYRHQHQWRHHIGSAICSLFTQDLLAEVDFIFFQIKGSENLNNIINQYSALFALQLQQVWLAISRYSAAKA